MSNDNNELARLRVENEAYKQELAKRDVDALRASNAERERHIAQAEAKEFATALEEDMKARDSVRRACWRGQRARNPNPLMFSRAKYRAKRFAREFTLTRENSPHLNWSPGDCCPACGHEMIRKTKHTPTFDRRDNDGGYTPENTWVLC